MASEIVVLFVYLSAASMLEIHKKNVNSAMNKVKGIECLLTQIKSYERSAVSA